MRRPVRTFAFDSGGGRKHSSGDSPQGRREMTAQVPQTPPDVSDLPRRVAQLGQEVAGLRGSLENRDRDLADAQELQRATREILQAIAASAGDPQPVLDTVAAWAARIAGAV